MGSICSRCRRRQPAPGKGARSDTFSANDLRIDCDSGQTEVEFEGSSVARHVDSPGQSRRKSSQCVYYAQVFNERARQRSTLSEWQQSQVAQDCEFVVLVSGSRALRVPGDDPQLRKLANDPCDPGALSRARHLFKQHSKDPVAEALVMRCASFSPVFASLEAQAAAAADADSDDGAI